MQRTNFPLGINKSVYSILFIHTHTYIYPYIYTYTHIHTYTHTYIYIYTYTHAYIHTHIDTYPPPQPQNNNNKKTRTTQSYPGTPVMIFYLSVCTRHPASISAFPSKPKSAPSVFFIFYLQSYFQKQPSPS